MTTSPFDQKKVREEAERERRGFEARRKLEEERKKQQKRMLLEQQIRRLDEEIRRQELRISAINQESERLRLAEKRVETETHGTTSESKVYLEKIEQDVKNLENEMHTFDVKESALARTLEQEKRKAVQAKPKSASETEVAREKQILTELELEETRLRQKLSEVERKEADEENKIRALEREAQAKERGETLSGEAVAVKERELALLQQKQEELKKKTASLKKQSDDVRRKAIATERARQSSTRLVGAKKFGRERELVIAERDLKKSVDEREQLRRELATLK